LCCAAFREEELAAVTGISSNPVAARVDAGSEQKIVATRNDPLPDCRKWLVAQPSSASQNGRRPFSNGPATWNGEPTPFVRKASCRRHLDKVSRCKESSETGDQRATLGSPFHRRRSGIVAWRADTFRVWSHVNPPDRRGDEQYENVVQVSLIKYGTGAGIGWHKDRPELDAL
jgi:hypothetical protein